jgi:hypothetical protein
MVTCHNTGIEVISNAFAGAAKGLICTPYYSERGLQLLDPFFDAAEEVEFWTRFSPLDWRSGVADMAALNRRVQSVLERGKTFDMRVSDDLHAKIYTSSGGRVILGSANLTWPGMTSNIEVICELTGSEASAFSTILESIKERLIPVSAQVFSDYVDVVADAISKPFDGPVEEDGDMNAAIELAEEALRKALSHAARRVRIGRHVLLDQFIEYCRREHSEVSRMVLERHEGKQNLQGHVKHCFYGSALFLSENLKFVAEIAQTPMDSLYQFESDAVRTSWRDFLRKHADEIDEDQGFSFRTLRVYLPERYGGICTGGGCGSSTLKRVLPAVARMLRT